MKQVLPVALVAAALGVAVVVGRGGRSRESLLPLSRAVAEHEKALDRGSAVVFPLSADEERAIGARLDAGMAPAPAAPGTPEASAAGLWRELGMQAANTPLVQRFRGRYEFRVDPSAGANAFALPGGFVYATAGLLRRMGSDTDAILFVLGHEIGHIELGHCADAYRLREGRDPLRSVLGGVASVGRLFASLHFSASQELEADAYGARLLKAAKRDPAASLRAMDALGLRADSQTKRGPGRVAGEALADYFTTHPGAWERRASLEREIARLKR